MWQPQNCQTWQCMASLHCNHAGNWRTPWNSGLFLLGLPLMYRKARRLWGLGSAVACWPKMRVGFLLGQLILRPGALAGSTHDCIFTLMYIRWGVC